MRVSLGIATVLLGAASAAADGDGQGDGDGGGAEAPGAPAAPEAEPAAARRIDPAYGELPDPREERGAPVIPRRGQDIVISVRNDRSSTNIAALVAVGGAGLVMGGIGLYFHLDSRDAANSVSANRFTGRPWTQERQDAYDRAYESRTTAAVFYGIGAALALGTIIAYIVTEPAAETLVIRPQGRAGTSRAAPLLVPTEGGGLLGGAWRF
jgi:hypothetical protein